MQRMVEFILKNGKKYMCICVCNLALIWEF